MKEGADCEEMYIVIEGNRSIILEREGTQLGGLSTGDFFGELGALLPPEMKHQRRRTRSAYATGETQLMESLISPRGLRKLLGRGRSSLTSTR